MNRFLLMLAIGFLCRLSTWALALDGWCFDRCYGMGGALVNERRRLRSQIRRRR